MGGWGGWGAGGGRRGFRQALELSYISPIKSGKAGRRRGGVQQSRAERRGGQEFGMHWSLQTFQQSRGARFSMHRSRQTFQPSRAERAAGGGGAGGMESGMGRFKIKSGKVGGRVRHALDLIQSRAERQRSTVSRAVIDPVAGYRPQSKGGVERMVAVVKQSFWSVYQERRGGGAAGV